MTRRQAKPLTGEPSMIHSTGARRTPSECLARCPPGTRGRTGHRLRPQELVNGTSTIVKPSSASYPEPRLLAAVLPREIPWTALRGASGDPAPPADARRCPGREGWDKLLACAWGHFPDVTILGL